MVLSLLSLIIVLLLLAMALLWQLWRRVQVQPWAALAQQLTGLQQQLERFERLNKEDLAQVRQEQLAQSRQQREELSAAMKNVSDSLLLRLDAVGAAVDRQLKTLQADNNLKLEQMRATVDEKLHATLERRLGESFKSVSERLEQVYKGLGEMQSLAAGVGDLKKVLTNVKTRGAWGEFHLGNLLAQILSSEQYAANVATRPGGGERVEFAIKLPGRDPQTQRHSVWLPIDAKFPQEDYQRLIEAQEQGDLPRAQEAQKQLQQRIRTEAKGIRDKYLEPPHTTDFGIMFLPTEGLFAEVLRQPALCEQLMRDFKVVVAGPTTLVALLNSLQMGFRTLAIEKRSSEVWATLSGIKAEFGRFGDLLDKTQKKLQEAGNVLDDAARKSRTIEQKLKYVHEQPAEPRAEQIGPVEALNPVAQQ